MRRAIFIAVWLACLCGFAAAQSPIYGFDLHGRPLTRLTGDGGDQTAVLFFLATDCPISNRYVPEIQRLEKEFSGRVTFWLVYPNAGETAAGVLQHQAAFGLATLDERVMLHPQASVMKLAEATITPESAVLVGGKDGLRAVYLGRIDDRYVDIGRERPQATRHDLEAAIQAVLNHQVVAVPGGPPVGCGIVSEAVMRSGAGKP
jgi:hypothetical protein